MEIKLTYVCLTVLAATIIILFTITIYLISRKRKFLKEHISEYEETIRSLDFKISNIECIVKSNSKNITKIQKNIKDSENAKKAVIQAEIKSDEKLDELTKKKKANEEFVEPEDNNDNTDTVFFNRGNNRREDYETFKITYEKDSDYGNITMATDYKNMTSSCSSYERVVDVDKNDIDVHGADKYEILSAGKVHLDTNRNKWVLDERIKIRLKN